jgi:hypothetical protein
MPILAPQIGTVTLLQYILGVIPGGPVVYHLYNNNHTPQEGDTLGQYNETADAGYSAEFVLPGEWVIDEMPAGGGIAQAPPIAFILYGTDTIYGYFVTDQSSNSLLWAEALSGGPVLILASGSVIQLTPLIQAI